MPAQPIQLSPQPIQPGIKPIQPADLPATLAAQVSALGGKPKAEAIRRVIAELCAWQPLSADELATLISRTRVYLVNEHLSPMIRDGLLAYTIPEQANHPQQKYRGVRDAGK